MITFYNGNIFRTSAQAIVNPVNCVGIMGKGLAYDFKKKWPKYYRDYTRVCMDGLLHAGNMHIFTNTEEKPKYIISFPTKVHWMDPSKMSYIREGLVNLKKVILELGIKSIAIPALGCGCGSLEWPDVKPEIVGALESLDEVEVDIYQPH